MTVWIVASQSELGETNIEGVFSTEQLAQGAAASCATESYVATSEVEEWEVE